MVLHLRQPSPGNWQYAKCRDLPVTRDWDPFFDEEDYEPAKAYCNGDNGVICPVRDKCLIFALVNNEHNGCWGGTDPITRKAIRKRYPLLRGIDPRPEWEWQTREQALDGLDPILLTEDESDYQDD